MIRGIQSALDPAGPQSGRIYDLWLIFLTISIAVYVITMLFVLVAILRGRRQTEPRTDEATDRRLSVAVSTGAGLTIAILLGLHVSSVATGRAIGTFGNDEQ